MNNVFKRITNKVNYYGIDVTDMIMPVTKIMDLNKLIDIFNTKCYSDSFSNRLKLLNDHEQKVWVLFVNPGDDLIPDREDILITVGDFLLSAVINILYIDDETPYMKMYDEVLKKNYQHSFKDFQDLDDLIGFLQYEILDKNKVEEFVLYLSK